MAGPMSLSPRGTRPSPRDWCPLVTGWNTVNGAPGACSSGALMSCPSLLPSSAPARASGSVTQAALALLLQDLERGHAGAAWAAGERAREGPPQPGLRLWKE